MSQFQKLLAMLAALIGAAGALSLYAYFGVMKPGEVETERKETKEKLFSAYSPGEKLADGGAMPAPVFYSLTVKAKGETTTLEKKDGKWQIVQPIQALADSSAVEQVASSISASKFKETIEENPTDADLEKYGLKDPKFSVSGYAFVPDKDGKGQEDPGRRREMALYGGIENTFNGSAYMRKKDDRTVYSADGWVRNSLEKTTFDLRDKEVLALEEPKIKKLEFKSKSNQYLLERDESNNWRIAKPLGASADAATVSSMLTSFRNQRATGFPSDTPDFRKKIGLDSPLVEVSFSVEPSEKVHIRLVKHKAEGETEKWYAVREQGNESTLAEVPEAAAKDLDKNAKELRDKTILSFKKDDVAKVAFAKAGGPEIVVQKVMTDGGPEDWQVISPEMGPAKKWKISSLLWTLGSLKASALGEENPKNWARYGLGSGQKTVSMLGADGKVLAKLEVGKEVSGKQNTLYARGSKNQVMEIEANRIADLPNGLADVLEKPMAPSDAGTTALKN